MLGALVRDVAGRDFADAQVDDPAERDRDEADTHPSPLRQIADTAGPVEVD
jgi:hypothetical protein